MKLRNTYTYTHWLLAATAVGLISLVQLGCGGDADEVSDVTSFSAPASESAPANDAAWQDYGAQPMDGGELDSRGGFRRNAELGRSSGMGGGGGFGGGGGGFGGGGLGGYAADEFGAAQPTPEGEAITMPEPRRAAGRFAETDSAAVPAAGVEEKLVQETTEGFADGEALSEEEADRLDSMRSQVGAAPKSDSDVISIAIGGGNMLGGNGLAPGKGLEGRSPSSGDRARSNAPKSGELPPVNQPDDSSSERGAADQPAYYAGHRFMLMDGFDRLAEKKQESKVQRPVSFDLQPGEELWIIAKAVDTTQPATPNPEIPGCGALMAQLSNETERVPVPLKHTAVEGTIDGYIATVSVTQQFQNPYSSKIEAVYVFPLPEDAAVNEFVMTVGDRKIRGIIREREKAEQIYAEARRQGHVASLLTQERPNIFTQKVANIEPGKRIDINIRYFNTLRYDDGAYEFVFPMVVGPRFNPPATTDGVGAVARGAHGSSGQQTEVQYLAPHERSGHDISLTLNINAGVDIEDVHSVNHAVKAQPVSECQRHIELASNDTVPNKDFVLRYKVAGDKIKTAMLTHEDEQGKYFTMMLYPPADLKSVQRSPMEMVFVLDCSGSMNGKPIAQAKAAIAHALQSLTPRDTFQIIQFSNNASQLGSEPVIASPENIRRGLKYLNSLSGSGGTQMIEGIKAALEFPHDEGRFRLVSFITDGYIGNEQQILQTLRQKLGASRIFSFGVGESPNRYLMDRMANEGRGAVAYLSLNDDAATIMDRFNQRISHPAMTDLAINWGGMDVADVYPCRLPDLIVGRPVIITGRFKGEPTTVKVSGLIGMEPASFAVALDERSRESFSDVPTSNSDTAATEKDSRPHPGIAAVWARMKIKDMLTYATHEPSEAAEIKQLVTQTALNYNLMSSFTAFVAVDSMTKTSGEYGTTVAVPVPVPEGVKYETTVR